MKRDAERRYREIAREYVEGYGAELLRELEASEAAQEERAAPGLDARVRKAVGALRSRRLAAWTTAAAACVVLLLATLPMLGRSSVIGGSQPVPAASNAASSSVADGRAAGETEDALIPLSFALPQRFSVAAVEQDVGKTIYRLADVERDDVVLTLERAETAFESEGLRAIDIGGAEAYGLYTPDYSVLAFQKDGIDYVMTCRHEIDTLLELGERIL